jgi:hypothetical protein
VEVEIKRLLEPIPLEELKKQKSKDTETETAEEDVEMVDSEKGEENVGGKTDIKLMDFTKLGDLGTGASGYVEKALHVPTNTIIALKVKTN